MHIEATPYLVPHSREPIQILHEDEHLLLVRKPDLLLSVPGRHPRNHDSLIRRLQRTHPTASIVHRLDLDTSGIMVVPLTREAHADISRQFQQREVFKTYEALVFGVPATAEGQIDLPLIADWPRRPLQKVCHQQGKAALTWYELLESHGNYSRMQLMPVTGRSHQLRIHMRELGHPILGCDMYGHAEAFRMAPRLMLHATRLGLRHPVTDEWLEGSSPAPF